MSVVFHSYWPIDDAEIVADAGSSSGAARIGARYARSGELVDAYPAGAHDRELALEGVLATGAVRAFTDALLSSDPRCRRVVLSVPEMDLDAIRFGEEAGFRYVVDVETRAGAFSLLVAEPEWVIDQAQALDDIPLSR